MFVYKMKCLKFATESSGKANVGNSIYEIILLKLRNGTWGVYYSILFYF